ncbi:hypothetical protein [Neomoorella thermoacetica]|uniref:hypothetical protein n=1 Tax=Neomoorella thermoacetica TaxID=1525 RepID=UPI0018C89D1A|nr:hypothetical protein [Moorella thermoacetica]
MILEQAQLAAARENAINHTQAVEVLQCDGSVTAQGDFRVWGTVCNVARAGYLNTLSVRIEDLRVVAVNQDSAEISIIIEALERTNLGEERTSYYQATYQVGLENGKLKLLKGTASKIR